MDKLRNNEESGDTIYIDKYSDQYHQIKDNLDIEENTDSETTNITDFRVINSNNPYPQRDLSSNSNNTTLNRNKK